MKLLNSSDFYMNSYRLKNMLVQLIYYNLLSMYKDKSEGLVQLLERYSLDEIQNSLDYIKIDNNGILYIPERTRADYILRYLEFGGDGVKPTHLISKVTNNLVKNYSKRR